MYKRQVSGSLHTPRMANDGYKITLNCDFEIQKISRREKKYLTTTTAVKLTQNLEAIFFSSAPSCSRALAILLYYPTQNHEGAPNITRQTSNKAVRQPVRAYPIKHMSAWQPHSVARKKRKTANENNVDPDQSEASDCSIVYTRFTELGIAWRGSIVNNR